MPTAATSPSDEQHPSVHRRTNADVAHAASAAVELGAIPARTAEQLGDQRAGDVETLGGQVVHLGVQLHAFAGDRLQAARGRRGHEEGGQDQQRQDREAPLSSASMMVSVTAMLMTFDTTGRRRARDGLLGADNVGVEA